VMAVMTVTNLLANLRMVVVANLRMSLPTS
jgi:hypothetical protein